MPTEIGPFAVRRSTWINAPPERVWQEFESLERMQRWYGTGHTLVAYEPKAGGYVETDAASHQGEPGSKPYTFAGRVTAYDPPRELTFEQDWAGHSWPAPTLITIRLAPVDGGTLVELFHHAFDRLGDAATAAENLAGFEGGWTNRQLEAMRELVEA